MNRGIRVLFLLALLVLAATSMMATQREVYYEYYSDATYSQLVGEKWILCDGTVVSWGVPTQWFKVYYGPCCE